MSKIQERVYAWILAFIMIFQVVPVQGFAEGPANDGWQELVAEMPGAQYDTVTFTDGLDWAETVLVEDGQSIDRNDLPEAPAHEGETFLGWKTGDGERVTAETTYSADIMLFAEYEAVEEIQAEEIETPGDAQYTEATQTAETEPESEEDQPETAEAAETVMKTVSISAGDYNVTATYDSALLPEDAKLNVAAVNADSYRNALEVALIAGQGTGELFFSRILKIAFADAEGNEIKTDASVQVRVQLSSVTGAAALEVVEFDYTGDTKISSDVENDEVLFTAKASSIYGIGNILWSVTAASSEETAMNLLSNNSRNLLKTGSKGKGNNNGRGNGNGKKEPAATTTLKTFMPFANFFSNTSFRNAGNGMKVMSAYTLDTSSMGTLDFIRVDVDAENLGKRDSVAVYEIVNGQLGRKLSDSLKNIDVSGVKSFAVVRDTGYRNKTLKKHGNKVTLTGEVPTAADAEVTDVTSAYANIAGEEGTTLAAYDIKIVENSEEYQPDEEHPVEVTITDAKFQNENPDHLILYHIKDDNTKEEVDFTLTNGIISFTATGFSIYAIVETGTDARLKVTFIQADGSTSMYVKQGDDMEVVLYDPGATIETGELAEGVYFRGWTTDLNYTPETTAKTIADIRTEVSTTMLPPAHDGIEVTYTAMLFKDYRITYLDENGISLGQEEVTFRADSTSAQQQYKVNMAYTVQNENYHFEGWNVLNGGSNIIGHTEGDEYVNNDIIIITGDVTFSVFAPEGHWFIFDENGKGATYNAPQFVYSADKPTRPNDAHMLRNGYTFGGWFTTKAEADQTSGGTQYNFNQTLTDKKTVYARWIPNTTAGYTIIIWKQNLSGDGYDFEESISRTGNVGDKITTVRQQGSGNNAYAQVQRSGNTWSSVQYTGFHLKEFDQNVTIKTEGNSVLNVYYDRNQHTLQFQVEMQGDYVYTPTTSNYGTQYGLVNGEYIEIWNWFGDWYYGSLLNSTRYYGTRYTRSGGGTRWTTIKEITALYGQSIGENFPIVGTNGRTYDHGERWDPQSDTPYEEVLIYIDIMPNADVTFHLDEANHSTKNIYYYVEALPNETDETVTYNGKTFVLYKHLPANYGFFTEAEDYLDFVGFTKYGVDPATGAWGSGGASTVKCYYTRNVYPINFMDGKYVDGDNNPLEESGMGQISIATGISYGADVSSYSSYTPDATHTSAGYVFEGWYIDSACIQPYSFNKMPEGGITVYAKWRQKEYRVFLHVNYPEGATGNINWGTTNQKMNFRVSEGGHVSEPTGRDLAGFAFDGWYLDEAYTQVFNGEAYAINENTVNTPYDKTVDMTDTYDNNGFLKDPKSNSDIDRFWITKKLDVYAKWHATLDGASGIVVEYDANGGTEAPTDTHTYVDTAKAPAGAASKAPAGSDKVFGYWEVQKWENGAWVGTGKKVLPGDTFEVLKANAKVEDLPTPAANGDTKKYTVQLKAVYIDSEAPTPTHIYWYKNDGTDAFIKRENVEINVGVDIPGAQIRNGYTFLGWARVNIGITQEAASAWESNSANWTQPLTESDLYLTYSDGQYTIAGGTEVTQVAPDENQPYHAMFAVWEENRVTINYAVADDSTEMGAVSQTSETVNAVTGTASGSTATAVSSAYIIDYWTCDDGTEHVGVSAHFTPSKNADGVYEAHTYYAHFRRNEATVTVHHYLKGTTTKVANDVTAQVTIESTYTAQPVTTYQEKNLTVDSYNPSQAVTVSENGNIITIYYTLPLEISVDDKTVVYNGSAQYGYGNDSSDHVSVSGLLENDSIDVLNYIRAEGINVGTYTGSFTGDPIVKSGNTTVYYYHFTEKTPGKLIITEPSDPELVVTKADQKDNSYKYSEGEIVTYTITVKNIYNVEKTITLTEMSGVDLKKDTFNNVQPGEQTSTLATYAIKPTDMAAGSFENTVTAGFSESTYTYQAEETVYTEELEPSLEVTKTANKTSGARVGETITYTVVVKNDGNVTVNSIAMSDTLYENLSTTATYTLAPEASRTFTYTYLVKQSDVNAGSFNNTVTVTGKDPRNENVTDEATATVTTEDAEAKLEITKTATPTEGVKVGDKVTYTVKVTNSGNVKVTGLALADDHGTPAGFTTTLEAGEDTGDITYTYTVTQADIDAGEIVNVVTATATAVRGENPATVTASATVKAEDAAAELEITKTATPIDGVKVGDTVTYTVEVTNSGNVKVTGLTLADDHGTPTGFATELEAGANTGAITYTYTVTQADVDAGEIVTVVTATAIAVRGDDPATVTASATVTTENAAAELEITKTATPKSGVKVGDTVTYTVKVTNSGNVKVTGLVLADDHGTPTGFATELEAGANTGNIVYNYTVTQADVDAGEIVNVVTATATAVRGDDPATVTASATVTTEDAAAELEITKTATPTEDVKVGDTVTYTVKVTNKGNVKVTELTLADDHGTPVNFSTELEAGEDTGDITYTYKVTQADVDAGEIVNVVTATATAVRGENPATVTASATVKAEDAAAELEITKTATPIEGVKVGDTVTYTVKVTNSGNVKVTGLTLADDHGTPTGFATELEAGANTGVITYTYTVTQADVDAGEIVNVVTATATAVRGENPATVTASATVKAEDAAAELEITKTATPIEGVKVGDTVTYTVKVTNTGNVKVTGLTLADDHGTPTGFATELEAGANTGAIT